MYDLAPSPTPSPPVCISSTATHMKTEKERQLAEGKRGREGVGMTYDDKKACSSTNHSILSGFMPRYWLRENIFSCVWSISYGSQEPQQVIQLEIKHLKWASCRKWLRSNRVVRSSYCQCRCRSSLLFDPSILRHNGIWGAADEAVLNKVQ